MVDMRIVTQVLSSFTVVFFAISVSTIGWVRNEDADVNSGLWRFQRNGDTEELDNVSSYVNGTRAMMLMATISAFIGSLLVGLKLSKAAFLPSLIIAGVAGFIGIVVFAAYYENEPANDVPGSQPLSDTGFDLSYSFALGVIGFLLAFASAGAGTKVE